MSYQPKIYRKQGGNELVIASGGVVNPESGCAILGGLVQNVRRRCTIAEVNAGVTLLAAIAGYKYRMVGCTAVSVGGAAAAVTTVDVLATQSTSSVKLVAYAQAGLTQSAVLKDGGTSAAVLADGASYVANDANTAITVNKTGASVTTATHIDVNFSYVVEAA
jgi:hypothetical protein